MRFESNIIKKLPETNPGMIGLGDFTVIIYTIKKKRNAAGFLID
jgi:hypothetical protein